MSKDADLGRILADIVEEAAELILPLWRAGVSVHSKADESPVTEADRRGEKLICQRLAQHFPDVPVIGEEHASEFGTPEEIGPRFFLVDPVDGTKAFIRKDPHFTVNIALIQDGRPVAGAVNAPAMGRTWFTTAEGSLARDADGSAPVRVRAWPKGDALCLISHTMKADEAERLKIQYGFDRTQPMDSSIKLCIVAEGGADIYPRHGPTSEWDIAAGHAVLEGAGGTMKNTDGSDLVYGKAGDKFLNGWFVARGR